MKFKKILFLCLVPFILLFPISFQASEETPSPPQVKAQLISEETTVKPGRPFWVGVQLDIAPGWDIYWMNPGDSGFPTKVEWQLPEGFKGGNLQWPYPQKFSFESLTAFGYTDSVTLLAQITPPETLETDKPLEIAADVSWLACKESCVPGSGHLTLSIPVTSGEPEVNAETATLFQNTRANLPHFLTAEEGDLTVQAMKEEIILNFKPKLSFGEVDDVLFFPEEGMVIDYAAPQVFKKSGRNIVLNLKRTLAEEKPLAQVKGVLLLSEKGNEIKKAIQVNSPVEMLSEASPESVSSMSVALVFAFLGGLILNVMPCVLPVVALKIFGFVKIARERRSVIFQHGASFSFGVLLSFWILSALLLILRVYGAGIGWGFQLQEPVFVAVLTSILFLLSLSLFGVFEFGTSLIGLGQKAQSSTSSPLLSSFMSGILATLVATPCTGPLLGPALGFAMTLPPVQSLSIFTCMGLGMAFPYLLFSAFPALVRFLPKPGHWMVTFKQLMGFLMMATVIWLVWVFGAETDNMATFILLGALLFMALGAWIFGRWGTPVRRKLTRSIAYGLAALMLLTGGSGAILAAKNRTFAATKPHEIGGWESYSPKRVAELRAQGKAVFVDFTAKWCLICQANKVILHSTELEKAFQDKNVVTLMADWTKKDPEITQELEKLGRSGVPVYVLYPSSLETTPEILPQTLSTKIVQEYLEKLDTKTTVLSSSS